ncbi:phosphate ABC transporter permease subunit PstC [Cellulosilyticum sp. I15G10I2]|uniref:phosphate ABC transporter permease subunit PstC n=1 Tax=Cellulosilyticum sp. I15G10I2 TaxID=1892843 RepID=UPI00085CB245|nr:phosphate ABC transporter permease subunit PstC [Cellulosilyticum sp. I15G10I2]
MFVLVDIYSREGLDMDRYSRHKIKEKFKDNMFEIGLLFFTALCAVVLIFIFIFILQQSFKVFKASGLKFLTEGGFSEQVSSAFNASDITETYIFGGLGLIMGTLLTTVGALLLAVPLGVGTAVVICELAPYRLRSFLSSVVRLLACLPSIIYGLVGLMVIVPLISNWFITTDMQIKYISDPVLPMQLDGKSLLAGILVLTMMLLPIITILSVDAIKAVPKMYKEAAFALGYSHWKVIWKVILPAAKAGVMAGVILAAGRGTGEAIALSMVCGGISNVPQLIHGGVLFLTPVLTLSSAIVNKSEAMSIPAVESVLFACAAVLLLTSIILSLFTRVVEYLVSGKGRSTGDLHEEISYSEQYL